MTVEPTFLVKLLFSVFLPFIFLCCPVRILAQEKPDPLIEPSPVPSPQQTPQQPNNVNNESVLVNTDLISFNVTVTDTYGRFVSGLSKKAFAVYDDKEAEDITFFSDDDAPLSIGVVFDLTGSMSGEKVKRAKEALSHFFETSLDKDEYFLITLQSGRAFLNGGGSYIVAKENLGNRAGLLAPAALLLDGRLRIRESNCIAAIRADLSNRRIGRCE